MAKRVSKSDMRETELQKTILSMSGRYTAYEIFMDWIQCSALAIQNSLCQIHDRLWQSREEDYKRIMDKYSREEQEKFPEMLAWLIEELEDYPRDVLGEVFMKSGMGSDAGGQFFTPFSISQMMAELSVESPEEGEKISLNEPSCGSGGSIIAAAMKLKAKGVNYQKRMHVVAQDLDWRCVYMCYVQLSYLGIDAICVQGDTLCDPYRKGYPRNRILRTPANMGALV
jgi:type I restriction-modification system DNA methylase subunit